MKIILQKYIAQSGLCSRRKAEELIRDGKVLVNGKAAELGQSVDNEDTVEISGQKVESKKEKIYLKMNKPIGYTCTNRKFEGEDNIFDLLPKEYEGLHVVGRLDKNSRGLIILTNDGEFTQKMTHPSFEHEKEYVVSITNYELRITDGNIKKITQDLRLGVDIGDGDGIVKAKEVKYIGERKFKIILTEGKKRQIRRMFKTLELDVEDLLRVRIGDVVLGDLEDGKWEEFQQIK